MTDFETHPAGTADRIAELESALEELGKCGSCGGSGKYLNKWIEHGAMTARHREELVTCTKCDGTGVNPIARAALK